MKTVSRAKSRWTPLGLALMLASSTVLADTQMQSPKMTGKAGTESVSIFSESGWANPALARAAAESGRALLGHLESARAFLIAGSPEGARDALFTAREFTRAMERTMPFMAVADDVKTARSKLISGEEDVFYDDLQPIYASVDDMQVYAPTLARSVQGKLKKAEAQARGGRSKDAAQTLREISEEVTQTTVYLPLGFIDNQIQVASAALKGTRPDPAKAQVAIDRALKSLVERQITIVGTPRK